MKSQGAGAFTKRVTIQRSKSTITINEAGHPEETSADTWETYCNRWAQVTYARGAEVMAGTQQVARRNPTFRLMHDSTTANITTAMRLKMDDRTFSVAEPPIVIEEDNRIVEFMAVEVVT